MTLYIGVDGASDGWLVVLYDQEGYHESKLYEYDDGFESLWDEHGDEAEHVLADVPIGLREESNAKRPCDVEAREVLGHPRSLSVFSVPVRDAVRAHKDGYEEAKAVQEEKTDGSLGKQTWNISDNIAEIDTFLLETENEAQGCVREAHPEVCFWALNNKEAMEYSKTGQPASAFWERVDTLEKADEDVLESIREAGAGLNAKVGNDDIVDAFALALTASPMTGELQTLGGEEDPEELPMEMVYPEPETSTEDA